MLHNAKVKSVLRRARKFSTRKRNWTKTSSKQLNINTNTMYIILGATMNILQSVNKCSKYPKRIGPRKLTKEMKEDRRDRLRILWTVTEAQRHRTLRRKNELELQPELLFHDNLEFPDDLENRRFVIHIGPFMVSLGSEVQ